MSEKSLYQLMKKHWPADIKLFRVENRAGVSIPDVHFIESGLAGWIELKEVKNEGNKIPFKKGQPKWLVDYWEEGGNSFILVNIKSGGYLLYKGCDAKRLELPDAFVNVEPLLRMLPEKKALDVIYNKIIEQCMFNLVKRVVLTVH